MEAFLHLNKKIIKSSSAANSIEKNKKKSSKSKLKYSPGNQKKAYDYKADEYIKQFKNLKLDTRTPRIGARISSKHSSTTKHKDKNFNTLANTSFCSKKTKSKQKKLESNRKRSSSSSPDIRAGSKKTQISK